MDKISAWVADQIESRTPANTSHMNEGERIKAINQLVSACVVLLGRGEGTLFGMMSPSEISSDLREQYQRGCAVLGEWFGHLDGENADRLALIAQRHELAVGIPDGLGISQEVPVELPEVSQTEIEAMQTRLEPGFDESLWNEWFGQWERMIEVSKQRGWDTEPTQVGDPLSAQELAGIEKSLGVRLPDDFVRVVGRQAASVSLWWQRIGAKEEPPPASVKNVDRMNEYL